MAVLGRRLVRHRGRAAGRRGLGGRVVNAPSRYGCPRLSQSMVEGTIKRWLHEPGARVRRGDELAEIETDKATASFEAEQGGVLEVLAPARPHSPGRRADRPGAGP
ncbi:MAG: lipoyl domain-containing protein [Pseudonocardia sp.]|nr:lipoyl domain-containing protein [Pseudonocardia sp.]